MKTINLLPKLIGLGLTLGLMACAQESAWQATNPSSANNSSNGNSIVPNTDSDIGGVNPNDYWSNLSGASAVFIPNPSELTAFYGRMQPLNAPSNFRLYLDLKDTGGGRWGGYANLGFIDNGQLYTRQHSTINPRGTEVNKISYKNWYVNKPNAEFNQWFNFNGKTVFHGFFQDANGALIVVIDDALNLGDGGSISEFSGSVWYKSFKLTRELQFDQSGGELCWFLVSPSPWECGTFKNSSGQIATTSSLYPGDGYKELGRFTGAKASRAFKQ